MKRKIKENRAKNKIEFNRMDSGEKQNFLSMDLIDRLIKVEQTVSASFNNRVPYNKTEYYKSLTNKQKKQFEDFLRNRKIKKVCSVLLLLLPIAFLLSLRINFTGNIVLENLPANSVGILEIAVVVLLSIIAVFLLFLFIFNRIRHNKLKRHTQIAERFASKKFGGKNNA